MSTLNIEWFIERLKKDRVLDQPTRDQIKCGWTPEKLTAYFDMREHEGLVIVDEPEKPRFVKTYKKL